MTLECVHNNNIAVFVVQYNYVVRPMARPGARGLGPGLGLKYDNCVAGRAGPGHTFAGRAGAGPGPGLIIQFAGRARTRSAQLLRARVGPGPQIKFAGRAWGQISGPCRALIDSFRTSILNDMRNGNVQVVHRSIATNQARGGSGATTLFSLYIF